MAPTPEQLTILAQASFPDSLLIEALAGAAKTTTLCLLAAKLPLTTTFCCAFNKKIADEMRTRMPSHIECKTLNSIGNSVWIRHTGKRIPVDPGKAYGLVKAEADAARGEARQFINENFGSLLRGVRKAKSIGYVPSGQYHNLSTPLASADEFLDAVAPDLDCEPDDEYLAVINTVLEKSIALAYTSSIDFDDQIYMPTLFGGVYPRFEIVMVDEAQDLSPLNHLMVEKLAAGRVIAVGDPNQSIYGFRGAHHSSMEVMEQRFSMRKLTLSVTFRCPQAVVRNVWDRVPQFKWTDGAPEGKVERLSAWSEAEIPDGAAIICRNNAPLFSLALQLLRKGRGVKLVGSDLGPGLVKLLKKLGPLAMPQAAVLTAIDTWRTAELARARESRKAAIEDRAACLRVFAEFGNDLNGAIAYAEHLFATAGPIQLMTGHKSKGLEFDIVFHLDPWRVPSKYALRAAEEGDDGKLQQELNLRYVISTRAKQELYLANLEDFN